MLAPKAFLDAEEQQQCQQSMLRLALEHSKKACDMHYMDQK